jgi:hypothetical protein
MKSFFRIALLCLVLLMLLTACQDDPTPSSSATQPSTASTPQPTEPTHHCAGKQWEVDRDHHWMICDECGKQILFGAHFLHEDECGDCKVTVTRQNSQTTLLTKRGTYRRYPDWEKIYDADGRLTYDATYTLDNKTNQFTIAQNYYHADGSREYALCDNNGYPVEHIFYDAKGQVKDTYTFTNQYDPDERQPFKIKCCQNGILLYEELYGTVYSSTVYNYLSRRIDYRPDGSYSVTKYNEKGKLKSYECFNADETPMNHSSRYDREAGRPLVGSWAVWVQSDTYTLGFDSLVINPINVLLTYTFDLNGNLNITQDVDKEQLYQHYFDVVMKELADFTLGEYATMEEKEAACQEKFGMSIQEYAKYQTDGYDLNWRPYQDQKGVYFVEDGLLYIADSWITFETEMDFLISMDTLTLITDYSTTPLPLKRVSADLSEYSSRFDPETCADLFGTWTGTVKVDGKSLGFEDTELFITANITVTFDEKGNITMVMEMDPEEYRNFSIQLVIESIKKEYSHMDPDRLDRYYEAYYGLPVAEYATAQVDAQNPAANAVAEWVGIYFIEEGLLYTVDGRTGESDGGAYSLEDGKLTIEDAEFGLSLVLSKENA